MKILIVSATELEIRPLLSEIHFKKSSHNFAQGFSFGNHSIDILITGIGMVATAYCLGKALCNQQYGLALNIGLAGSFGDRYLDHGEPDIGLGKVAQVTSDRIVELGVEDADGFRSMKELGLMKERDCSFVCGNLKSTGANASLRSFLSTEVLKKIPKVSGITVNKLDAREKSINAIVKKYRPSVESMEGAAFMFACRREGIPCLQLRAISNFVGVRDKKEWNISLAVKNLNKAALDLLKF